MTSCKWTIVEDDTAGLVRLEAGRNLAGVFGDRLAGSGEDSEWLSEPVVVEVSGLRSFALAAELVELLVQDEYPPALTVLSRPGADVSGVLGSFVQPEVLKGLVASGQLVFGALA